MPAIEEQLTLDVAPALAGIQTIDDALQQVVSSFEVGLADAFGVLRDLAVPELDTTPITEGVTDAIDAAAQQTIVLNEVDATPIADVVQSEVASALEVGTQAGVAASEAQVDTWASLIETALSSATTDGVEAGAIAAEGSIQSLADQVQGALAEATAEGIGNGAASADATEAIGDAVGKTTEAATKGFGEAATAASAFGATVAASQGKVDGLATGLVGRIPLVGGAFVALGAAALGFANQAERAVAADERLNIVFGDTAERVTQINVGGLVGDLSDLAKQAGSSASNLKLASAQVGQFGLSFGTAREDVLGTVEQLQALSLRAVALNPQLGDAGDALVRLQRALVTGRAQALAPFALGLDKTAIAARAAEIALADGRAEVTTYDKVAAGAALATERLGTSLGTDFAEGAKQSAVQIKALEKEIKSAAVAAGRPLVQPIIEGTRALVPIAVQASQALGVLFGDVVPLGVRVLEDLGPSISNVVAAFGSVVEALGPVIEGLGVGLGAAAAIAAEVLDGLATVLNVIAGAIDVLPDVLLQIGAAFVAFRFAALQATAALTALGASSAGVLGPLGLLAGELAALYNIGRDIVWGETLPSPDAIESVDEFGAALDKAFSSAQQTDAALNDLDGIVRAFLSSLSTTELENTGLVQFVQYAPEALDGLGAALRGSRDDLDAWIASASAEVGLSPRAIDDVTDALVSLQDQLQGQAKASAVALIANGELNASMYDSAVAQNTAADGQVDYVAALDESVDAMRRQQRAQEEAAKAAATSSGAFRDLTNEIIAGNVVVEDAADIAAQLGIAEEDAATFIKAVSDAVVQLSQSFTSVLPVAADAFAGFQAGIGEATAALQAAQSSGQGVVEAFDALVAAADPQRLVEQFAKQAAAIASFQTNIEALLSQGLVRTAQVLLQQGPVVGGAIADALVNGEPETRAALEGTIGLFDETTQNFETKARTEWAPRIAAATGVAYGAAAEAAGVVLGDVPKATVSVFGIDVPAAILDAEGNISRQAGATAEGATGAFSGALGLGPATQGALGSVTTAFGEGGVGDAAYTAGFGVGQSFGSGIVNGIGSMVLSIATAAAQAVDAAEAAARLAAESQSPSKRFARLGADLGSGMAVGLAASSAEVEAAAVATVDAAANAARRRATSQKAEPTIGSVQGSVTSALRRLEDVSSGALDRAQRRTTAALTDTVDGLLRAVSGQLAGTSAADRFRLTTGALTVVDLVQPMSDTIASVQAAGEERIGRAFGDATDRIEFAFDRAATRLEAAFDRFVAAERRRAEQDRTANVNVTVVGASSTTATAAGQAVGQAAAQTLRQRGVAARVRSN